MNPHSGPFLYIHTVGKGKELKLEQSDFPKADKYGPLLWVRSIKGFALEWHFKARPRTWITCT